MNLLMTFTEVATMRGLNASHNDQDRRIVKYIEDAQLEDLRPLVGDKLFWDVIADKTATANGSYPDLLAEKTYSYDDITYTSPGVKEVLACFVEARYRYFHRETDMATGFRAIEQENARESSEGRDRKVYAALRKSAYATWEQVALYLDRNSNSYTHWHGPEAQLNMSEEAIVVNRTTLR